MNKVIIILACILLRAPGALCQEPSTLLCSLPSGNDIHGGFSDPRLDMDKERNPFAALPSAGLLRDSFPIDSHLLAADKIQAAGASFRSAKPQAKTPGLDHSYLIELSNANWRPLSHSEKFGLFQRDLLNWETHATLALDAGLSLATNDRPFLRSGGYGFLRRYGFNMADEANFTFFGAYLFPTMFHEDPRYIPMDHGTNRARTAYALSRVAITRNDAGRSELNKSLILGTIVSSTISSAYYYPAGGSMSAGGLFASVGISLASDAGFNLFKEYWPNVSRKLKLNLWIRNLIRSSVRDTVRIY
jgi:hypothetical protein